ncbi:MAG TPA: glycosyltransferase [Thermoleophilaceae bacterium]
MRVALLDHAHPTPPVRELAVALAAAGCEPAIVTVRRGLTRRTDDGGVPLVAVGRLPEAPLRLRGFERPLTHLPLSLAELVRGGYDAVHAFRPADAAAALAWRRVTGGPVVFSPAEPPGRDTVSNRRLRLRLLAAAVERSDAVTAPDEAVRAATLRWLAVEAPVLDAAGHVLLYDELVSRRPRGRPAP